MLDAKHPIDRLAQTRQLFRDEETLQGFISTHHDWFPALRKLGLRDFKPQGVLDSGRRVDFLCKDRRSKQLVAIELKVREPADRAVGQLQRYVDDLKEHGAKRGYDSTRLIVIAGQPDKSVRNQVEQYARSRDVELTFFLYRVD